jgi:hypothetical protein
MNPPRIIAEVRDEADAQQALRAYAETFGASRDGLDEAAGLTKGYSAKVLADPPVKPLTSLSLFGLLGAMKLMVHIVEDPNPPRRRSPGKRRVRTYDPKLRWQNARQLRMASENASKAGKMGAIARMEKTTPRQRSRSARKAAKTRWKLYRTAKATKEYVGVTCEK